MTLGEAHILLVEDESILRITIAIVLRRHGAHVTEAMNGAEALAILKDRSFDLLLTDWQMPVMNGQQLLRALETMERSLPTILFAGLQHTPDELAGVSVAACLLKPVAPTDLIVALNAVLLPLRTRNADV